MNDYVIHRYTLAIEILETIKKDFNPLSTPYERMIAYRMRTENKTLCQIIEDEKQQLMKSKKDAEFRQSLSPQKQYLLYGRTFKIVN